MGLNGETMNGVDYTRKLAVERDNAQNMIQKDREYTQGLIKQEQAMNEAAQKKQRSIFDRDRADLETGHQEKLQEIREKTAELTANDRAHYHEQLEGEKNRFQKDRIAMSKDFDSRLRNIQDSYKRNTDSTEKANKANLSQTQKRYEGNVDAIIDERDHTVKKFQDRMIGAGANLREQHKREQAETARKNDARVQDLYKDEAQKRYAIKDQLQGDLELVRKTHEQELQQLNDYNREKTKNLQDGFAARATGIAEDYSRMNNETVRKQAQTDHQRTKEAAAQLSEVRRSYDRDIRNQQIQSRRRDNGSGEFAEVAKRQQGKDEAQVLRDRVEHLQDTITEQNRVFAEHRSADAEKNDEMFRKESVESANRYEKQGRELTQDKIVNLVKEREKATKLHTQQEASLNAERNRYERQLLWERGEGNKKLTKLKENFNESFRKVDESNKKFVEDLRKASDEDHRNFLIESSKQHSDQISEMRRNFNLLMDGTTASYEDRLNERIEENRRLRDMLDQKVAFEREHAEERIQKQTEHYNNKRAADDKSAHEHLDQREASFRKQMRDLSSSYQRRMDKQQYESEIKHKTTVKDYEYKLKSQAQAHAKELGEVKAMHEMEIKRLTQLKETEKAQIATQLGNELNQAREAHRETKDRLDDYKRIG